MPAVGYSLRYDFALPGREGTYCVLSLAATVSVTTGLEKTVLRPVGLLQNST